MEEDYSKEDIEWMRNAITWIVIGMARDNAVTLARRMNFDIE